MTKKARPSTPNQGAADLRRNIVAYLRREIRSAQAKKGIGFALDLFDHGAEHALKAVLKFVQSTDERAGKKAGGLGKN